MFDIAPTELLLVAIVALVVIGPKDLPRAMRFVGQWVGKARGMARHFRSGIDEMIRQSELQEMEQKWAEENARIMREHPATALAAIGTTPRSAGTEDAIASDADAAMPSHDYAMTPLPPHEPGAPADTGAADIAALPSPPRDPRPLP